MLITFLESSRFHPSLAVRYCGNPVDANGQIREEVRVLIGSPQQFEQTAAGLTYTEKYKSAVLAFAPEDDPSEEDVRELLDEFLNVCFAGLARERFVFVAYLHRTATKVDVHVLIPKVDLWTGKQINVAPPGWQFDFDPLRDAWNWRKGWARPDDPRRARALQPGNRSPAVAALIRKGLPAAKDPKKELTEMLLARVTTGQVKNRADVIAALSEVGKITRDPEDSVSIRLEGATKNIRLKGELFLSTFDAVKFLAPRPPIGGQGPAKSIQDVDPRKEQEARVRVAEAIERRSVYNLKKFRIRTKQKKGVATAPAEDLMAALADDPPSTTALSNVPDEGGSPAPSSHPVRDVQPEPSGLTPSSTANQDFIDPKASNHATRKRTIYDRATHIFHALLEDVVRGMHERFQDFASAIRQAGERLAATGRAMGAQDAVARATDSETRNPGGSKERVTADRTRDSGVRKMPGRYER